MEKFHDFIKRVFDEQYEASFGSGMLEKLEPQDYYLRREEGGRLIALLHAQQVLENIHIKALVVDKEHQKKNRCRKWKTDNLYKKRTWIRCKGRGLIKIGNHYFKSGKYVYIVKCKYTV